ncbi:MAG TPA: hypothetical protein VKS43_01085 [Burkholderiales bacterium]|nr:hypothetical protein [Burkholderiales bacterium]
MGLTDWISKGGNKPDETAGEAHPLESEAGIRELQKTLASAQPAALLDHICDALEAGFDAKLDHKALRRALRMLDGGAQKTVADLLRAVLRGSGGGQIPELPAAAVIKYCRRIGALCDRALDAPEGETMTAQGPGNDALIAVRAMRLWALRKKLLRMSYRFPDEEFWNLGNQLYLFAHMRRLLDTETEPYLEAGGPSSVRRERLTGLMLDMAPNASMSPAQMECLDLVLQKYSSSFVERDAPAADVPFYVDLARPQPPQRWLPGLPARQSMRFFGAGDSLAKIGALAADAAGTDKLPPWAEASGCTPDAYRLMLAMLAKHWSDKPPQRRERRVAVNANVFLVNGFDDTRRAVAASEEAVKVAREGTPELMGEPMRDDKYFDRIRFGSVNPDKTTTGKLLRKQLVMPQQVLEKRERAEGRPAPENSALADTSESGIGVALPGRAPWARVGVLVGYRAPDSLQWEVAVVRRLVRGARLSLGLERLRGAAVTARIAQSKTESPAANATADTALRGLGMRDAILFPEPANLLVAPEGACAADEMLVVTTEAGQLNCKVARILEQGPDFVVAAVEKTAA